MALTVQTNNAAMTALKNLNANNMAMNKSLNRLSSGFRVNNAADDASGYAVSSKLDAQTQRLKAASLNATQAQAMTKMADAGVNEIQNMVVRLETLATQAASANNAGELGKLDAERIKLESAIDKIAGSTNYNGVSLLDGTAGVTASSTDFLVSEGLSAVSTNGAAASTTFTAYLVEASGTATGTFGAGDKITLTDGTTTQTVAVPTLPTGQSTSTVSFGDLGITLTINSALSGQTTNAANAGTTTAIGTITTSAGSSSSFQVGADNSANNRVTLDLTKSYTTTGLGLTGDLTTQANAQTYIDTAKTALNKLVNQRADLGATQNQVAFIQSNLATSIEQTTASVSSIRDADMAAEMADFTKNKILAQAGTAMLAQANQAAQNVMTLFR